MKADSAGAVIGSYSRPRILGNRTGRWGHGFGSYHWMEAGVMVEPIKMGTRVTRASQHGKYHQKIGRTKPDSDLEKIDQNLFGLRLRVVLH